MTISTFTKNKTLLSFLLFVMTFSSHSFEQTYGVCSMDAWDHFRIVDMALNDVPQEKQLDGKGSSHDQSVILAYKLLEEKGASYAYMIGHITYLRCAQMVSKNPQQLESSGYKKCASQSAARTHILADIEKGLSLSEAQKKYVGLEKQTEVLYRKAESSFLNAVKFSRSSFEDCFKEAYQMEKGAF